MSLKKTYSRSKPTCKVKFILPAHVGKAKSATVVGDFNDWKIDATPMKKQKEGPLAVTVELEKGRDYQFRYLVNGEQWENDDAADRYEISEFSGVENSVVSA